MKSKLKIVSRSSNLALKQVEIVEEKLSKIFDIEVIKIKTQADKNIQKPLHEIGGKGLFVKELEKYLLEKKAHIAIHSLKDVETKIAKNTFICAVSSRESRHDVLLGDYKNLSALPNHAIIGTSSPRRTAFLKAFRKDFQIKTCRGNIETRIDKLKKGEFHALILAEAGLKRLNIDYNNVIPLETMPPSAGQGVIAIQCLETIEKKYLNKLISSINDERVYFEILAERSLVRHLNGSCQSPISSSATSKLSGQITLQGSVANINGTEIISDQVSGENMDAEMVGKKLADILILKGARKILDESV